MAKYGAKSKEEVGKAMHEFKEGKLKSGKSGKKVSNPKQAIAIGLSKARKKAAKCPPGKAEHDFPQLFRLAAMPVRPWYAVCGRLSSTREPIREVAGRRRQCENPLRLETLSLFG